MGEGRVGEDREGRSPSPHTLILTPHSSLLTPHSSLLTLPRGGEGTRGKERRGRVGEEMEGEGMEG